MFRGLEGYTLYLVFLFYSFFCFLDSCILLRSVLPYKSDQSKRVIFFTSLCEELSEKIGKHSSSVKRKKVFVFISLIEKLKCQNHESKSQTVMQQICRLVDLANTKSTILVYTLE